MNSTSILKSKFYSLSTSQLYSTVLSTSVTMFYLRFSDLIPLKARSLFRSYLYLYPSFCGSLPITHPRKLPEADGFAPKARGGGCEAEKGYLES